MKVTFTKSECKISEKASKLWDSGICVDNLHVFGLIDGKIKKLVSAGFYMGKTSDHASALYCIVSVGSGPETFSASGLTKGCGYHKKGAALEDACFNAGIRFEQHIAGDGLMTEALFSIAKNWFKNCDPSSMVFIDNNIHSPERDTTYYLRDDEEQTPEMDGM